MIADEASIRETVRDMLDAQHYPARPIYLVAALEDVQACFGFVPAPAVNELASYFSLPAGDVDAWLLEAHGVFRSQPLSRHVLRICHGPICRNRGVAELKEKISDQGGALMQLESHCLGACDLAPAIRLDDEKPVCGGRDDMPELVRSLMSGIRAC